MQKNKGLLSISAILAGVIVIFVVITYFYGNDISNRFFGNSAEKTGISSSTNSDTDTNTESNAETVNPDEVSSTNTGSDSQPVNSTDNTTDNTTGNNNDASGTEPAGNTSVQSGDSSSTDATSSQGASDTAGSKEIKKIKARAIYLSGTSAGSTKVLDKYIDLINKTELNAVVIDVKEGGKVNYKSSISFIANNNLSVNYFDPEKVLKKLHDNNIYVIGRIVCFRDDGLARARPELAIKKVDGTLWTEGKLGGWTNPYNEEVWKYNIEIAQEAVNLGFDEIQFDYVRFPTAKKSEVNYGEQSLTKKETINSFLKKATEKLRDGMGVPVAADVFGIIAESKSDGEAIGQDLDTVGLDVDYICPMVYPSHYAKGQQVNGVTFAKPDFEPYQVVLQTLLKAKDRISAIPDYNAIVRPYLQDFTASYLREGDYQEYGAKQVREQIQAVYDAGYEEWILWDGRNTYTVEALEAATE